MSTIPDDIADRNSETGQDASNGSASDVGRAKSSLQISPSARQKEIPSIYGSDPSQRRWYGGSVNNNSHCMRSCVDHVSAMSDGNASTTDDQSISEERLTGNGIDNIESLYTARFKHVVTNEGHAVVLGRDGDTLRRCEDEPIHIPGAVQSFGLLLALQEVEKCKLQVRVVSENAEKIIGYAPQKLFALDSFCDVLSEEQTENFLDRIDFIRDEDADPAVSGPEVFTMSIKSPRNRSQRVWCAMHINERNKDLVICEFELENDTKNPLVPPGETSPEPPEDTLKGDPTEEEFAESTTNISKPLRVLKSARKRQNDTAAMDVFNVMSQIQEQLANAPKLDAFLKVLVGVVKELTGFHRVMIYQFDQAWNGRVVTELVDPRATKDLYKDLNFPASDIPRQARDLYKLNKVRLLYDRDQETARLVCRTVEDLENPLDLTYSYLRAMSPIHIKYLANMAVRSSMSISITAFGELWGLIACHTYGSRGMRVSFPVRKMCRIIGDTASRNIERLSYASRLQARKLINTVPTQTNPSGYIVASSEDLLTLFDADCGFLSIRDQTKMLGSFAKSQEALALLEYLKMRKFTSVTHTTNLAESFPDLHYGPGFESIAGCLLVPLTVVGNDFIVFFRKGHLQEVKWAGNPYEKYVREGTEGYLEPRKSFKTWSETVIGQCRVWTDEQIETAAVLCLVYGKFIEVWRQKEAALQSVPLTRLLLANTAHEVRTPLNAIINYLEIAMESDLDPETKDNLAKSHSASKSLISVINDLLDLTKAEEGQNLIVGEVFDFPAVVRMATDPFIGEANRKQIAYNVHDHGGIPSHVIGDSRRVRQIISNVTANAVKFTTSGAVGIELWLADRTEKRVTIEIAVQDSGCGMSTHQLDAIFNELEQIQTEYDEGLGKESGPDASFVEGGDRPDRPLGLGLAVVARTIWNMNGQLRLKSEEGKGSRIVMQLGFDLPSDTGTQDPGGSNLSFSAPTVAGLPAKPPMEEGEIMLVNKSTPKKTGPAIQIRKSIESMNSIQSMTGRLSIASNSTGGKSEVDRLIEAIQEPMASPGRGSGGPHSPNERPGSRKFWEPGVLTATRRRSASPRVRPQDSGVSPLRGQWMVPDSRTPIHPVSVASDTQAGSAADLGGQCVRPQVLFNVDPPASNSPGPPSADGLRVLVAEDDPINSKIIKKRLEKAGHRVHLTVNGEECASTYADRAATFDVVLMDMQMPIVDGMTSVTMIRSFEKTHPNVTPTSRASLHGRVPTIAVSASLEEGRRQQYVDAGFDGWILKPVDFGRLQVLFDGIVDQGTRDDCVYVRGHWERGGWFLPEQPDVFRARTTPSGQGGVGGPAPATRFPAAAGIDTRDEEQDRLEERHDDAMPADSMPGRSGASGGIGHTGRGT